MRFKERTSPKNYGFKGRTHRENMACNGVSHKIFNIDCINDTVNTRIQEQMISEVWLIGFLFNGCLVTNQPQSVLKMFLHFYISNTGSTQKCP